MIQHSGMPFHTQRIAALILAATAPLLLVGCSTPSRDDAAATATSSATSGASGTDGASSSPTTHEPAEDGSDGTALDSPAPTPTTPSGDGRVLVQPTLTSWGADDEGLDAAAVISGIVEATGTCTLTATQNSAEVSVSGPGNPSASSTDCGQDLVIDRAKLSAGEWTIKISYSSANFTGVSQEEKVEVK